LEALDGAEHLLGAVDGVTLVSEAAPQFHIDLPELLLETANTVFESLRNCYWMNTLLGGAHFIVSWSVSWRANWLWRHYAPIQTEQQRPARL